MKKNRRYETRTVWIFIKNILCEILRGEEKVKVSAHYLSLLWHIECDYCLQCCNSWLQLPKNVLIINLTKACNSYLFWKVNLKWFYCSWEQTLSDKHGWQVETRHNKCYDVTTSQMIDGNFGMEFLNFHACQTCFYYLWNLGGGDTSDWLISNMALSWESHIERHHEPSQQCFLWFLQPY